MFVLLDDQFNRYLVIHINNIYNLAIINEINYESMNLKERGITIGDLLIVLILVISTVFIVNKNNENDKQAYFQIVSHEILTTDKY